MVRNVEDDYERMYPFAAFRRYRKGFSISSYDRRAARPPPERAAKRVSEHVVRIHVGSRTSASAKARSASTINSWPRPTSSTSTRGSWRSRDIGGYVYNAQTSTYRARLRRGHGVAGATCRSASALGATSTRTIKPGLSGIERIERVGSFFDKVWVIQLLTQRGAQAELHARRRVLRQLLRSLSRTRCSRSSTA